jgi:hypothetical protein
MSTEIQNEMEEILTEGDAVENTEQPEVAAEEAQEQPQEEQAEQEQGEEQKTDAEAQKPVKHKLTAQERIAQIQEQTRLKWEAHRAVEAEKIALQKEREELQRLRGGAKEEAPPRLEDYTEDQAHKYLDDLAEFKANKKIKEKMSLHEKQTAQQREQAEMQKIQGQYEREYQIKVNKDPSFAEKEMYVAREIQMNGAYDLKNALLSVENRLDLVEYLGDNPETLGKLLSLPPQRAYIEIGKITGQMQVQKPRTVSKAPAPISPSRSAGTGIKSLDDLDHKSFSDLRNKQEFGF